jgi:hypothetical protein
MTLGRRTLSDLRLRCSRGRRKDAGKRWPELRQEDRTMGRPKTLPPGLSRRGDIYVYDWRDTTGRSTGARPATRSPRPSRSRPASTTRSRPERSSSRRLEARNGLVAAGAGLAIALSARVIVGLVVSALQ